MSHPIPSSAPPLTFSINGTHFQLPSVDPSLTLLSFIRSSTPFRGTKLSCGEGGCGACVVLLSKYDVHSKQVEEFTINSCLTLLCSVDGCAITTTEGLGNSQNGFHAVHKRLAGFHGSQCGFCSPGMCISMYSCLRRAQQKTLAQRAQDSLDSDDVLFSLPEVSAVDAQMAVAGNICRCTGYRPILDACKSFAGDVDLEDLGLNAFWPPGKRPDASLLPAYAPKLDPVFPKFLVDILEKRHSTEQLGGDCNGYDAIKPGQLAEPAYLNFTYVDGSPAGEKRFWVTPITLEGVFEALKKHQGRREVKLVVGNTSAGIYKDRRPQVFVDISQIPELLVLKETTAGIEVGAAVTIEKLIHTLEASVINDIPQNSIPYQDSVFHGILSHLKRVSNIHVRNRASVGGNLIMAQQLSFDSDLATIFLGAGVSLKLITAERRLSRLSMEDFLQKGALDPDTILLSIFIPSWHRDTNNGEFISEISDDNPTFRNGDAKRGILEPFSNGKEELLSRNLFRTYRAAPRRLGNSVSYVNAAFLVELSAPSEVENKCAEYILKKARLAYGAFGQKHAIRAGKVENFLMGKAISPGSLLEAIEILKVEVVPIAGIQKTDYRSSVAVGFLFDFFIPFLQESPNYPPVMHGSLLSHTETSKNHNGLNGSLTGESGLKGDFLTSMKSCCPTLMSGRQKVELSDKYYPVGQPTPKWAAELQASGEAVYVDDIAAPENCLFAAFVYSEKAWAKIKHIHLELALASPGVVSYVSADDIPKRGKNIGVKTFLGSESLFASEVVECVGQPLGVVVADTPQHARDAAAKVKVDYESLGSPILSIEDAVAKNSFFEIPPPFLPKAVGDIAIGFSKADKKIEHAEVRTGSQYFFYMENQTTLVIPDEDDCLIVYSSCQGPAIIQDCISTCLGVPFHNVRVITRRVGGGFGGKAFRAATVATACAVAAYKLQHPVRMYLDRNIDMIMMGGRHPTKTIYSVGFTSSGKVTALQAKVFVDAGWSTDLSPALPIFIIAGLKKYDWGACDVEFKVCKTNLTSKSAMRAPGDVQGSFIADTVIEHVAAALSLDVHTVIERNMHTLESAATFYNHSDLEGVGSYTLPAIWSKVKNSIYSREEAARNFNYKNKWLKRGLAITPCIYEVVQTPMPARVSILSDGSVVLEVGGVELGQGLWTKVKQTAVHGLSQLFKDQGTIGILNVRVVQADTISLANAGLTSNSTTSEGSCEAVRQACKILVDRLMPIKVELEQKSSSGVAWVNLVKAAKLGEVELSAQIHWFPEKKKMQYLNYGVAASEVEVDILTGETTILETDLIYDCGQSLNPAVDIGQIEGAFVQGIGFFMTEEHLVDCHGKVTSDGTWTYKPPTIDNIPFQFNVELLNGEAHQNRILSSKACGEPPLLLAGSVHSAIRRAIEAAREDLLKICTDANKQENKYFRLDAPATIDKIKTLCGLNNVEQYLEFLGGKYGIAKLIN